VAVERGWDYEVGRAREILCLQSGGWPLSREDGQKHKQMEPTRSLLSPLDVVLDDFVVDTRPRSWQRIAVLEAHVNELLGQNGRIPESLSFRE